MKKTKFSKILSLILCAVLIAAMALFAAGCGGNDSSNSSASSEGQSGSQSVGETSSDTGSDTGNDDGNVLGEGDTAFTLSVTFSDGSEKSYTVKTDKTTVGDALSEVGLISGSEGPYGLMVETVAGETVKYEDDGKYWAFYIDGEYAMTGVDATDITDGAVYSLKVE